MQKINKKIFIILLIAVCAVGAFVYYGIKTDWFVLWRLPKNLSPQQIEKSYEQFLNEGLAAEAEQKYAAAILAYQKALKIAPDAMPPRNNIAEICLKTEDYGCAEKWLLEIIKKEYDPGAVIKLSRLYREKMGDNQKAVDILRSAQVALPSYLDFAYQLGFLYKEIGDKERAKEYLNKALKLAPNDQNIKDLLSELNK